MFCTNCGKEIIDTAKFCNFCGSPILNAAASVPVQPVSPVSPTPTVQPAPGFSESADVPVTENNYGGAVGEAAEIAENNNETISLEAAGAAVENITPEETSAAVDTDAADIPDTSNAYNAPDVSSATNAPNVPTPNTIPTYGTSGPVYSAPLAYPSPAQSMGTIPVQSAEPKHESKPERKYTLGHIMMCLAAVAVMAIVAGVFAGLYFSVV